MKLCFISFMCCVAASFAFEFPKNAKVRKFNFQTPLTIENFKFENNAQPGIISDYDKFGALFRTKFDKQAQVKTVFYPMSSYDVSLPIFFFPDATEFIFLDDHPAFDRNALPTVITPKFTPTNIRHGFITGGAPVDDIIGAMYIAFIGDYLIGEILKYIPGSRIHSIEHVYLENETVFFRDKYLPASHLRVEFSTVSNTSRKTIIFINGTIGVLERSARICSYVSNLDGKTHGYTKDDGFATYPTKSSLASTANIWWFREILKLEPQAYFVKSQGAGTNHFDSSFFSFLVKHGGFLIADQPKDHPAFEIGTNEVEHEMQIQVSKKNGDEWAHTQFGYENCAKVFKYRAHKNDAH